MNPSMSLRKPKNSVTPRKGLHVNIYFSTQKLGSGVKPYLIIGVTGRYVTLYSIPRLLSVKVKRHQWPELVVGVAPIKPVVIAEQLTQAVERAVSAGWRFDKAAMVRATEIIQEEATRAIASEVASRQGK
jgi:hypothetical protein